MSETQTLSGEQALAYGAWAAGVYVAAGYPGSPSTDVIEHLSSISTPDEVHVQWSANEKVAFETALGASLTGRRALVCMKSVGLNIALDPVMTANLTGVSGGLVLLVGDDPGAWASQNEQDSRYLATFAELPLIEPASPAEAAEMMEAAFDLSEEVQLPVLVREIRDFSRQRGAVASSSRVPPRPASFVPGDLRWVSLPFNVVANHRRLHRRVEEVADRFEDFPFNRVEGRGPTGIVAAGFAHAKLRRVLPEETSIETSVLKLSTLHPLPEELVAAFLTDKRRVLVIEETGPFVEEELRALAQRRKITLDIWGKGTGHLPREGILTARQIRDAVTELRGEPLPSLDIKGREAPRPSEQGLCEGCFYIPLFEALRDTLDETGHQAVICADPGCSIRIHQPPFEMLHVKHSMGSAIGLASGLRLAGVDELPIALVGDSSFFHTGVNGLLNAVTSDVDILVLILDNGSAALTGGQPHPGSGCDVRGRQVRGVQLEGLVRGCGVDYSLTVDPTDRPVTERALREALLAEGLRVIIARGRCTRTNRSSIKQHGGV